MSLLDDLYRITDSGEPLPLAWVVAHGDAFPSAWARSTDVLQMLKIAAHVVPRQQLVIAACAVARTALPFVPDSDLRPLHAIKTAEAWARGAATKEEVEKAAGVAWERSYNQRGFVGSSYVAAAGAATYAADVVTSPVPSITAAGVAGYVADAADAAGSGILVSAYTDAPSRSRSAANRRSARIIRKHIHITVADLIRAGKNGWKP